MEIEKREEKYVLIKLNFLKISCMGFVRCSIIGINLKMKRFSKMNGGIQ